MAVLVGGSAGGERESGGGSSGGNGARTFSILAAATANWDVTEGATVGPVAAAGLAEMARLREVVVVVVAELGVGGLAAWALELFGL